MIYVTKKRNMSSFIPCYDFRLPVIDDHSRKPYLKSQSEAYDKDTIQSASPSGQRPAASHAKRHLKGGYLQTTSTVCKMRSASSARRPTRALASFFGKLGLVKFQRDGFPATGIAALSVKSLANAFLKTPYKSTLHPHMNADWSSRIGSFKMGVTKQPKCG